VWDAGVRLGDGNARSGEEGAIEFVFEL
jgi:hypothetical protein